MDGAPLQASPPVEARAATGEAAATPPRRAWPLLAVPMVALVALVAPHHKSHGWWPDEHVYLQTGARLAIHGRATFSDRREDVTPAIAFYHERKDGTLVPQYPPGFPTLLAIAYRLAGPASCYWLNVLLGIGAVALTYVAARELVAEEAALAAACLLAVNPVALLAANSIMADTAGALLVSASVATGLAARSRRGNAALGLAACSGLLSGGAVLVRFAAIAGVAPGLILAAGRGPFGSRDRAYAPRERLRALAAHTAGAGVAAFLLAAYQMSAFGQLRSPYVSMSTASFATAYFPRNLADMIPDLRGLDAGALLLPGTLGLFLLAARSLRTSLLLVAWGLPICLLHLFYVIGHEDPGFLRFFLIAFPALAIATAHLLERTSGALLPGRPGASRLVLLALVAALALPSAASASRQLAAHAKEYFDARELVALVEPLPEGTTVIGQWHRMQTVCFYNPGRFHLYTINHLESKKRGRFELGSGAVWRNNILSVPPEPARYARANRPRIRSAFKEGRRALFVVSRGSAPRLAARLSEFFEAEILPASSPEATIVLIEVRRRPKGSAATEAEAEAANDSPDDDAVAREEPLDDPASDP